MELPFVGVVTTFKTYPLSKSQLSRQVALHLQNLLTL